MLIHDILIERLNTISSEATMAEAEALMKEFNFRHLPVTDGKAIIGILSDRDIMRATTVLVSSENRAQNHIYRHKKVSDFMTTAVIRMQKTQTVENVLREMIRSKVSSILIENEKMEAVGIITTEDLLILLLDTLESRRNPFFERIKKIFNPKT